MQKYCVLSQKTNKDLYMFKNNLSKMKLKYYIHTAKINKKYQRKQVITWEQQKQLIYDIIQDLSKKKLFSVAKKDDENYNILENYTAKNRSLTLIPTSKDGALINANIFDNKNNKIKEELTESNFKDKSNIYTFTMGLIKHEDIELFKDGDIESIFKYLDGNNSGLLAKTYFSIIVDDDLRKIIFIKQSTSDTVGISAFCSYCESKSSSYKIHISDGVFNILSVAFEEEFKKEDIKKLKLMSLSIDGSLIRDYKNKSGKRDAFLNLLLKLFPNIDATKSMEFTLKFLENGNTDAVDYFNQVHTEFVSETNEQILNLVDKFKVVYDSQKLHKEKKFNFRRTPKTLYEIEIDEGTSINHIQNLIDSYIHYKESQS